MSMMLENKKHEDFYQGFRKKIDKWLQSEKGQKFKYSKILLVAPDLFHLLCKLSLDPEVPAKEKAKLAGAIAYFVSPIDLIPDIITGPIGYIDDVAVAAFVLNGIINSTDPEIVKKHWVGDEDILEVIKHIIEVADEMLGSGLWQKIKAKFN